MSIEYRKRIQAFQEKLKECKVDYFILADADPHNSEYVGAYYKLRTAYSGFTGSNGTLLIGQEEAFLWTDGRYFIQAEIELKDSGISLMRMGDKGVPTLNQFLASVNQDSFTIGYDGSCLMQKAIEDMVQVLEAKGKKCVLHADGAFARTLLKEWDKEGIYQSFRGEKIRVLPHELRGRDVGERISVIRQNMSDLHCDVFLSCKLDTNMWLLNIRGNDIAYNPVAFSYVMVTKEQILLFIKEEAVTDELKEYANEEHILLKEYESVTENLAYFIKAKTVLTDLTYLNADMFALIKENDATVINGDAGTGLLQAIKTEKEIALLKDIYRKDSVAVCKFLYWLDNKEPATVTEYDAACKMDALREEIPENRGLSFYTIAAYGFNAAMMHYETKKDTCAILEDGNLFLLDSGGQYDGGTTDVTRTVCVGQPTQEMCEHFTMVVRGMLALQNGIFMKGCTGMNLDILAREPMWEAHMDYKCGTGHGIGYMLNVHEGPQAIRMKSIGIAGKTEIVPGMLVSDEPGIYLEGKYGIRMENILLCEELCENADGTFLHFVPLTLVPVDMRLICKEKMQPKEWKWLMEYQRRVCEEISSFLSQEEREWLLKSCKQ